MRVVAQGGWVEVHELVEHVCDAIHLGKGAGQFAIPFDVGWTVEWITDRKVTAI